MYTVRPRNNSGFSVAASEAREALDIAKDMIERGVADVEILGFDGKPCELADLERIASSVRRPRTAKV